MRNQSQIGVKNSTTLSALEKIIEAYNTFGLHKESEKICYEAAIKLEKELQTSGYPVRLKIQNKQLVLDKSSCFSDLDDESLKHWKKLEDWAKAKIGTEYKMRGRRNPVIFETYALDLKCKGAYFTFKNEMHGIYINYEEDIKKHETNRQNSK